MKKYFFWIVLVGYFLILYHPVLNTYFTQDDFFHFKIAQTDGSLKGLTYLIGFHPFAERQIAFYRPLFRDLLYHFSYNLFFLNHLPLRILSFVIHMTNAYLISKIIYKLFKSKFHAYFTAFFYTIGASNVATLYYLAGGIQVLGALMFILLSLISYLNFLEQKRTKYIFLTYLTFILALASHEQSFILPFLLLGIALIKNKKITLLKNIKTILPTFVVLGIYLYLNYFIIGYSKNEVQYQALFDIKRTLNSLIWYSGWAMGLPEMLQDFMPSLIQVDPRLMRFWGNYYQIIFPAFFVSLGAFIFMAISIFIKKKKLFCNNYLLLLLFWYLLGLAPVIFLPSHKSSHYLTVSLPAFWGILGYLVSNYLSLIKQRKLYKVLVTVLIVALITLSSTSAVLGKNYYWAAQRGKLAQKLINQIKEKYPTLPKGTTLYIKNDPNSPYVSEDWGSSSKQAYYILNGSDALQLLYKDLSLKIIYEDINKEGNLQQNFVFTPKIY
jgi:hypothetical protein